MDDEGNLGFKLLHHFFGQAKVGLTEISGECHDLVLARGLERDTSFFQRLQNPIPWVFSSHKAVYLPCSVTVNHLRQSVCTEGTGSPSQDLFLCK